MLPQQQAQQQSGDGSGPASKAEKVWERQMKAMWRFAQQNPATARGTQAASRRFPRAMRPPPPPRLATSAEAYASMSMMLSSDEDASVAAAVAAALVCPPRSLDPALGWRLHLMAVADFVAQHGRLPEAGRDPACLTGWLCLQRAAYKAWRQGRPSSMAPERAAALEAVPGFSFGDGCGGAT